jgi:hypothetical protein
MGATLKVDFAQFPITTARFLSGTGVRFCVFLVAGLLLSGTGCRPVDACAETTTACGGDPVGAWAEASVCQDPALQDTIASKQTYRNQPAVSGGQSPPELTSMDWCSALQFVGPNGIRFFALPRDTPAIQGAYLSYESASTTDHTQGLYSTLLTSSDRTSINYSASCLRRFGYPPGSCTDFGLAFADYGKTLGGIKETKCQDSAGGGCLCSYLSESDAAGTNLSGIWKADGHVITHYAGSGVLPTKVDYCVEGNQMTLWGHNRTNILDITGLSGLRILTLRKVVCGDGFADHGEDCDPPGQRICTTVDANGMPSGTPDTCNPVDLRICSSTCQLVAAP